LLRFGFIDESNFIAMRAAVVLFTISILFISCGGDDEGNPSAPAECTQAWCPFVGVWRLNQLLADGNAVNENISSYRLDLKKPTSGESGNYQRTFASGESESGTWSVTNNGSVIVLDTPDAEETYIVESVSGSSLILVFERESVKPGPDTFRFSFTK
jgi:hypothetical protein